MASLCSNMSVHQRTRLSECGVEELGWQAQSPDDTQLYILSSTQDHSSYPRL